jgi:type 1 glutamine amidotransferase
MLAALMLGCFVLPAPALAQDDFKLEKGFTSLFNGKDLAGWQQKGKEKEDLTGKTETPNKKFSVEDGAIKVAGGGGGDLYTIKTFEGSYHLKLEFRAAPKADSGVYVGGKQLQVRDYPNAGPYKKVKFNAGDWNTLDIIVTGTSAECRCNDEVIEKAYKIAPKGGIGLQSESGKFEYRRIRIKVDNVGVSESPALPDGEDKPAKKRLLLITESRGFVHDVVNRRGKDMCLVEKIFVELAAKEKFFEVDYSQDSRSVITSDNLKKYDGIFFYTTLELPLSDTQKSDLLGFVKGGKGFGGSHCATDTLYKWPAYGEMIGAYFDGHPWNAGTKIRVIVEDKNHPATKHLGDSFEITDEIYQFKAPYDRKKLNVLMRLDMDSVKNQGKRKDKDNALAWTKEYGKGRVFYTALGHQPEVWNDPRFQQHVVGGLRYMFGMDK